MKILLIVPPFPENGMSLAMRSPPLGLMMIAGAVDQSAHPIEILDLNVNKLTDDQLREKIPGFDMVGVTLMTNVYLAALHVLKIAKECGVRTIVGGFHPSLCPEMIELPEVDLLVRGEGETTFAELLAGEKDLPEILGLSYKKDGVTHHNPDRELHKELDSLPIPAKNLIDPKDYFYAYLPADVIEASRGCPYACDFCCVSSVYHRRYREKSPERVIEEMKSVHPSVKVIFFVDDNFTMNMKRTSRICDMIEAEVGKKYILACQSRIDTIVKHPDIIAKMSHAGFKLFFLGIESIHQKALDHMQKKIKSDDINKALNILEQNGILSYGSFIVGNIGENRQDAEATMQFIKNMNFTFIQAGAITPYPATVLYQDAIENGWLKSDDKQWWTKEHPHALMDTPDLKREEIEKLTRETMKSFYYYWPRYVRPSAWARVMSHNYRWWWEVAPTVIFRGVKDFLLRF